MRFARFVQLTLLATMLGSGSIGCGSIEVPLDLALVGDNTITISPPSGPALSTTLVGGVETTVSVNIGLFSLLNPNGIVAGIGIDDILIAGENIPILGGILNTGTLCIAQNPDNPGGGNAHFRILQSQADIMMALNMLISPTDEAFLALLEFIESDPFFPFDTTIDTTVPVTFADLFGLLLGGGGGGGLELSQDISTTLPATIPFFGGAAVDASLTLASVDAIPVDPLMADCVTP
jgi:hypothetical protein